MRIRVLPTVTAIAVAAGATAAAAIAQNGDGGRGRGAIPGDFNGDGHRDIAGLGGDSVIIVFGGPAGADPARRQVLASSHLSDKPLKSADFDSDGYADLLTRESRGNSKRITATIIYGGPRGLTTRTAALPEATGGLAIGDFDGNGVPDVASTGDAPKTDPRVFDLDTVVVYANPGARPGKAKVSSVARRGSYDVERTLLTGDFNGDHRTDLMIGASSKIDGVMESSWFELHPGTPHGLGPAMILPEEQTGDAVASDAVAGDFDGDGRTDLLADVGLNYPPEDRAELMMLRATAEGFVKARRFDDAALGLRGRSVGTMLAGDVNADGRDDLIVGTWNPLDRWSQVDPGAVSVLLGSSAGPTTKGGRTFRQGAEGVPGAASPSDRFGDALALTDTNGDGRSELVVGAPGEDDDTGGLYIFPGTAAGTLTTKGVKHFGSAAVGLDGKAQLGEYLLD
ncbi:FG-GAP and VCBS repeat-containing protein [Actinomadura sp. B10D3]|uniref:VCBS repeat-containing protein n=1 Tax=Actinomadura sp. B10D3 TaxID=3153557 RepID=UPI00325F0346